MQRLRRRADFLAAAAGAKAVANAFVLQARARGDDKPARVGFAVARKVGTAVERNRIRRRLREIARRTAPLGMRPGHDYVLIGRRMALSQSFEQMLAELARALRRVHAEQANSRKRRGSKAHATGTTGH